MDTTQVSKVHVESEEMPKQRYRVVQRLAKAKVTYKNL